MDSDEILSALETEFEDSGSDFIHSDLSDASDQSIEDVIENSQFDFEDDIEENSNDLMFQVCIINHKIIKSI